MKNGSTLIELLIYIAIVSGIAMASVMFVTDIVRGRVKSVLQENVAHNARAATRRLSYEIRQANDIVSLTNTSLCLSNSDNTKNPTRIYESGGRLYLGWGGNCTNSTTSNALTSTDVIIAELAFRNTSVGNSSSIDYSFKVSGTNTVGRQEWIYDTTASSSATLR